MQKLLISSLIFGSLAIVVPSASAAPAEASVSADPQIRVQIGPQRRGRRVFRPVRPRTRTYTRIVGYGRNRVRETVRVTYLPNGRTRTTVIRRTRVGRNW